MAELELKNDGPFTLVQNGSETELRHEKYGVLGCAVGNRNHDSHNALIYSYALKDVAGRPMEYVICILPRFTDETEILWNLRRPLAAEYEDQKRAGSEQLIHLAYVDVATHMRARHEAEMVSVKGANESLVADLLKTREKLEEMEHRFNAVGAENTDLIQDVDWLRTILEKTRNAARFWRRAHENSEEHKETMLALINSLQHTITTLEETARKANNPEDVEAVFALERTGHWIE